MKDLKFIIMKNGQKFKSDTMHHYQLARVKGFEPEDIIESGVILENKIFILDCLNKSHLNKKANNYVGNRIACGDEVLIDWLRNRELESQLYYSKQSISILKDGD